MKKIEFISKYLHFIPDPMREVFLRDLKALAAYYNDKGEEHIKTLTRVMNANL